MALRVKRRWGSGCRPAKGRRRDSFTVFQITTVWNCVLLFYQEKYWMELFVFVKIPHIWTWPPDYIVHLGILQICNKKIHHKCLKKCWSMFQTFLNLFDILHTQHYVREVTPFTRATKWYKTIVTPEEPKDNFGFWISLHLEPVTKCNTLSLVPSVPNNRYYKVLQRGYKLLQSLC